MIIGGGYPGLGDALFFSHIPRLAKQSGKFKRVFIYDGIALRNDGTKELIWELNPYVDGFTSEFGRAPYTLSLALDLRDMNLLDFIMLGFGLDDGTRWHEPEIYYQPKFRPEFHKNIFDPNWFSNVGELSVDMIKSYFADKKLDAVMKARNDKALWDYKSDIDVLETPTLQDFCDLIYSSKRLYCLTTGTASLVAALKKPCTVLYGKNIGAGHELARLPKNVGSLYHHSALHSYILLEKSQILEINFSTKNQIYFKNLKILYKKISKKVFRFARI